MFKSKWRKVNICKDCGKIYPGEVPDICVRRDAVLYVGQFFRSRSSHIGYAVARPKIFGWEVKE